MAHQQRELAHAPVAASIGAASIGNVLQAKASRGGGKKPKTDVPDYAKGAKWDPSEETLHGATDRVIGDNTVGVPGTGPTSDFNRIKKYLGGRRMQ
jgi:hypothetical protein